MPVIFIHQFKRSPEVKARLAEKLTNLLVEECKVPADQVEVIFQDLPIDGYFKGGKLFAPSAPNVIQQ
jgi:phenylpyruvate tautomerase PptA (4-oxalocrotonate tautomerase family)